ncbi:glycosyltransferase family 2 protein [Pedobacter arcticus]|uniref:glycosyltransferase family 2 protein n=1 Tax=Pedobacter arcticus TaxID=752140 RepID=UPI0002D415A3|nr:glycosyltransferase family 2 protein [Pedobacter arcticus]
MLSICIPHYNFVNPHLFESLFTQCKNAEIIFEILIVDDASRPISKTYLKSLTKPGFKIFFLKENIGRAAIRNFLAKQAQYPYLLFLDGDAAIITDHFITRYLDCCGDRIVSGGRVYDNKVPKPEYFLHYKYGTQVEQLAEAQFQSNNFLVPKSIFSKITFDEEIKGYGYEDVIFGWDAKRLGLELIRINNPVQHIQLKSNHEFISDTEQALLNLKKLIDRRKDGQLEKEVRISAFYRKLKKFRLTFLLSIKQTEILAKARELLCLNLPIGSTLLIAIYKLYYYHSLQKV